jgi:hypothetical protein
VCESERGVRCWCSHVPLGSHASRIRIMPMRRALSGEAVERTGAAEAREPRGMRAPTTHERGAPAKARVARLLLLVLLLLFHNANAACVMRMKQQD